MRFGIVDRPDDTVKTHKKVIPYCGGVGILAGLAAGLLWTLLAGRMAGGMFWPMLAILAAAVMAALTGLVDDILNIRPLQKIAGQGLSAWMVAAAGVLLMPILGITLPAALAWPLALLAAGFLVLGATNSINLLDGLDGLCGGITVIICVGFFCLARMVPSDIMFLNQALSLCLLGAAAGFLLFNYPPAKIFMGDAGSLLIGLVLAVELLLFLFSGAAAFLAALFIFTMPILDSSVAILRRLLNKRPIFSPDRGHVYDQIMDRTGSLKKTIWTCYALSAGYAGIGLIGFSLDLKIALLLYAATFLVTAGVILQKGFLKMSGLRGAGCLSSVQE